MPNPTAFTELNGLSASADKVFRKGRAEEFDYSDGQEAEQKLYQILSQATDLRSTSAELESQIVDWPTEYHLSTARANLLRGLNLQGVSRILELGCGCGAISRYLGEHQGLQVDSVEGSSIRASLAALRCRDLPNVTITAGNFNEMEFPADHYDLVLYIGVTEYAGRFSRRETDQEALQELLALGRHTVTQDGAVLIAIENRTGLKYMMGASEDHYGVAYVGIDNYPQSTGIRTYTKAEWHTQIDTAGFESARFIYAFPDYKVPTLLVDESCDLQSQKLKDALAKIKSRDYLLPFDLGERETRLWQAVLEAGTLGEFANSFVILLGDNPAKIQALLNSEIIEYQSAAVSNWTNPETRLPPLVASNQTEALQHQIAVLRSHSDNLQQKIELMAKSRGWSFLNRIRAAFGRSTIAK